MQTDGGFDGIFLVVSFNFGGGVRVTVIVPKRIRVGVWPKLGSEAKIGSKFWPEFGLNLA